MTQTAPLFNPVQAKLLSRLPPTIRKTLVKRIIIAKVKSKISKIKQAQAASRSKARSKTSSSKTTTSKPATVKPTPKTVEERRADLTAAIKAGGSKGALDYFIKQSPAYQARQQMGPVAPPSYRGAYSNIDKNIVAVSGSLASIARNPTTTTYTTGTGEKITHMQAVRLLITTRKELTEQRTQLKTFEEQKYKIEKSDEGYKFTPTKETIELVKEKAISKKEGELKTFYEKGGLAARAHIWSTGALSYEDPLSLKSLYHTFAGMGSLIVGDKKGDEYHKKQIRRIKAKASIDLDEAISQGAGTYILKVGTGPVAAIGTAFVGGAGIGAASGYATGKIGIAYGAKAVMGLKLVEAGVGVTFGAMAVKDVVDTYHAEGADSAFAKAGMFAAMLGFGMKGYKTGKDYTYQYGARAGYRSKVKTMVKKGQMTPEKGKLYLEAERGEHALRKNLGKVDTSKFQKGQKIDFGKAETLKDKQGFRDFFKRHAIRRKGEVFGSASEGRESIHDIDIMYKNYSQALRETTYGATRTKSGDITSLADVKKAQKPGDVVGRLGTRKEPGVLTKDNLKVMRLTESAKRHGDSALELAHEGRGKDIARSLELYKKIYSISGKKSTKIEADLAKYAKITAAMEKDPLLMGKQESALWYQSEGLGAKVSKVKGKLYETFVPQSFKEASFLKTQKINLGDLATPKTGGGLPPSQAMSLTGSLIGSPSLGLVSPSLALFLKSARPVESSESLAFLSSPIISSSMSIKPSKISRSTKRDSVSPVSPSVNIPSPSVSSVSTSISPSASISIKEILSPSPSKSKSISISSSARTGTGGLRLPGLDLRGRTDESLGFVDPFHRSRKHKVGDILGEMAKVGEF